jgi:sugar lactone lactonase YvrE
VVLTLKEGFGRRLIAGWTVRAPPFRITLAVVLDEKAISKRAACFMLEAMCGVRLVKIACLIWVTGLLPSAGRAQYAVTLAAGSPGQVGTVDGAVNLARFNSPRGVAVHPNTGQVFVLENSHTIRRFTPGVGVDTFAGSLVSGNANGLGMEARFNRPEGLAIDSAGTLYVADTLNHLIRRVTSAGEVTTLAGRPGIAGSFDGNGTQAEFNLPRAIAIGPGGTLLVADSGNHTIRRIVIDGSGGVTVTTVAGQPGLPGSKNGTGTGSNSAPQFNHPQGLAVDGNGVIFVADTGNNAIRRISPTGVTSTFAGSVTQSGFDDGLGGKARFSQPVGLTINPADGLLHVLDQTGHTLRRVSSKAEVRTVAGVAGVAGAANGIGPAVRMQGPRGVSADSAGNLFIADSGNHTLRRAFIPGLLPTVTLQPLSRTLRPEQAASFAVQARGPEPLIYQWRRNGQPIAGATSKTYAIPSVGSVHQGHYDVVVENPWGVTISAPAALVVTGQTSVLWATRIGGSSDDAALDLAVLPAATPGGMEALWLAALDGGQTVQQHNAARGQRLSRSVLDKKSVGLHAIALDANRNVVVAGQSVLVNNGRPAIIYKRGVNGRTLWSRSLATERGGRFSPGSNALVHGLAVGRNEAVIAVGVFQGSGKFGEIALGEATATVNRAFVCKLAANGEVMWAREIFSAPAPGSGLTAAECLAWSVTVDDQDSLYIAGVAGPQVRFQNGTANAADEDFTLRSNSFATTPWVAKYDAEGTLQWAQVASHPGHYFCCRLDADQQLWVTGVEGDRTDAVQQQAVLQRHDPATGSVQQSLKLAGAKGVSLALDATQGLAWLVMDSAGLLNYQGRQLGVPGYRCISLEPTDLSPRWDHPVLGALSLNPLTHSEQADVHFGAGGRVYLAVNFQAPALPNAQVDFCGRIRFPMKNRRSDGFLAAIGELPRAAQMPQHQLSTLNAPVALSVEPAGFLTPRYQWLRNGRPMLGQTSATLTLPGAFRDAAAYSVRLSNGIDQFTTPVAQVGIVDTLGPGAVVGIPGGKVTLPVQAAGRGLSFAWSRDPAGLPVGRSTGANSANLVIRGLLFPDDAGAYTCTVTGPGLNTLTTAPRILSAP